MCGFSAMMFHVTKFFVILLISDILLLLFEKLLGCVAIVKT